jgi:hypothetical protein
MYSITAVAGATGYTWSLPAGATITAGTNTNSITVTFATTGGNIKVTPSNSCGSGTASPAFAVTVNAIPGAAGAITGSASACDGQAGVVYSIPVVAGATGYTWTLPAGATITAGTNTNNITVTFGSTNGTVSVVPTSATCGNGTSSNKTITLSAATAASVSIACTSANICAGVPLTFNATPTGGGATPAYQWKLNNGNVGTNSPSYSATLGGGDIVTCVMTSGLACATGSPATSNQLTVITSGTSPCGNSTVVIGGPSSVTSNQTNVTYFVTGTIPAGVTYTWTLPPGSTIVSQSADGSTIVVNLGSTNGSVSVVGKDASNNVVASGSLPLSMSGATGISHGNAGGDTYVAYPTPFTDEAVIKINSSLNSTVSIRVVDSKGITMYTSEDYNTNQDIVIGKGLAGGVYLVQVTYENRIQVIKLVKI